jgi:hypothetical protein
VYQLVIYFSSQEAHIDPSPLKPIVTRNGAPSVPQASSKSLNSFDRRHFIGGSDARIIMGQDEKALIRLWQEKRGEVGAEDLSSARLASGTFRYHPFKCIISFADPHRGP